MTNMIDRKVDGKFEEGVSGNPNGRPKGVKNKKMTNSQVAEFLGKRKQSYFEAIEKLAKLSMQPTEEVLDNNGEVILQANHMFDPKLSFTCFKELIGVEMQANIFEYKKEQDKKNNKGKGKILDSIPEEDEPDMTTSLKSVK